MVTYEEALAEIAALERVVSPEWAPLSECHRRVLAEDLRAPFPSPAFTNSAMDGFAVRHCEAHRPLKIAGTLFAGAMIDPPAPPPGSCVRIMTGAAIPPWADTVVPVERAAIDASRPDEVTFLEVPPVGSHLRCAGEDLEEGAQLLRAGTQLGSAQLLVAAHFGLAALPVWSRPRILLVNTGDELLAPGERLRRGAVFNSTGTFLRAAVAEAGLKVDGAISVPDDAARAEEHVRELLQGAPAPRLILSTGAVSAGERDFVPALVRRLGLTPLFHKVSIRPGKPILFARAEDTLWIGFPGNPVSTFVGWHFFARAALARWAGIPAPEKEDAELITSVRKPRGLRCFFRARVVGGEAEVFVDQGSSHMSASLGANALVVLPENEEELPAGRRVRFIRT